MFLYQFPIHTTITCLFSFSFLSRSIFIFPCKIINFIHVAIKVLYQSFTKWPLFSLSSLCLRVFTSLLVNVLQYFFFLFEFSRNSAVFTYFNPTFSQLFFWALIHQISAFFFFFTINVTFYFSLVESVAF